MYSALMGLRANVSMSEKRISRHAELLSQKECLYGLYQKQVNIKFSLENLVSRQALAKILRKLLSKQCVHNSQM